MSQGEKRQSDKTKNQLMESMRKSKSAGATPAASAAVAAQAAPAAKREKGKPEPGEIRDNYSVGGLRWPD